MSSDFHIRSLSFKTILLTSVALLVTGCTPERDQDELFAPQGVGVLVVDAVLIVDQPLPALLLSRTVAPNEPSTPENSIVSRATVIIEELGSWQMVYRESSQWPGVYVPEAGLIVDPEKTYELSVFTEEEERLTAQTITPPRFSVDAWVMVDTQSGAVVRQLRTFTELGNLVYEAPENQLPYAEGILEARFQIDADQGFQLGVFSLDLDSDYVIDPPFFEDEDFEDLERNVSSPAILAEAGTIRLPWFSIYYEGRHLYKIYRADENWFELLRSIPEGDGGLVFGGNAGDNFNRPAFNIQGGIGLFGSASVDSVGFYVHPAP